MNIIDIHCHTAGIGAGGSGCFVSAAMRRNIRFGFFLKAFGVSEQELQLHGDAVVLEALSRGLQESKNVSAAVVLALDGAVDARGELDRSRTECYIPNDFLARSCRHHKNLLFGASINPYRRDALERLDQVAEQGALLMKWLPSIQDFDPAAPRLKPFYRKLSELGLPLLTHTGIEDAFTRADNRLADPIRLRLALEEGVDVIAAHCASSGASEGQKNFTRFLQLAERHSNLYADYSSLTQINRKGDLRMVLAEQQLHDRLVYGTDMPLINTCITSPLWHLHQIGPAAALRLSRIKNPWDRDVELKKALGITDQIFTNSIMTLLGKKVAAELATRHAP